MRWIFINEVSDERHRVADSIFGRIGSSPLVPATALVDESVAAYEEAVCDVGPILCNRGKWALAEYWTGLIAYNLVISCNYTNTNSTII